jgi:hypothetical protein
MGYFIGCLSVINLLSRKSGNRKLCLLLFYYSSIVDAKAFQFTNSYMRTSNLHTFMDAKKADFMNILRLSV